MPKTTLSELTDRYMGLSQALGSFKSAVGYDERTRELNWVHRANGALIDALSHGVRRSAQSADMVELAMSLSSQADELFVDAQQEAARAVRRADRQVCNSATPN